METKDYWFALKSAPSKTLCLLPNFCYSKQEKLHISYPSERSSEGFNS